LFERYSLSIGFQPDPLPKVFRPRRPIAHPLLVGVTTGTPRLPKTLEQLQFLQRWFGDRQHPAITLLDGAVTPNELATQLQASTFLHISCHGKFSPDHPEQTGWQLAPEQGQTQIFGLTQIFQLDLRHLRHATLLSCWGADNFVLPGRWILSLPEVPWRAGAGSIVACLWQVSEDCALEFVRHFYAALPGRRTDEALREAQRQLMHKHAGGEREAILETPEIGIGEYENLCVPVTSEIPALHSLDVASEEVVRPSKK
jgi:CHAT domain-containing protein